MLCAVVNDPASAAAQVKVQEAAIALMGVPCLDVSTDPDPDPDPDPDLISPQVKKAKDDITEFVDAAQGDLESALVEFDNQYDVTLEKLDTVQTDDGSLKGDLRDFFQQIDELDKERLEVRAAVDDLDNKQDAARDAITDAFADAEVRAADAVRKGTQDSIDEVSKRSAEARAEVTDAFTRSEAGMRAAAAGIAADGRDAINEQKAGLDKTSRATTSEVESNVRRGLDLIADTVSASTRNTGAAGRLLTADLITVLLDLGDPEVEGAGLLGTLGANAGDARAADFQLALAARTASSYANARGQDIGGMMLRQAQAEAAFKRQAQLQAFQVDVPDGVERRTVYSFHLAAGQ